MIQAIMMTVVLSAIIYGEECDDEMGREDYKG